MKISEAKKIIPFVDDGKLKIVVNDKGNKITSFEVTYKNETKTFKVKDYNILAAWKQVEKYVSDIK